MTFVEEDEKILSQYSSLFSTIITLYTLILLYCPSILFFQLILSPTLISTLILLLTLLRLGESQISELNSAQIEQSSPQFHDLIDCNHKIEPQISSKCEHESVLDPYPDPRSDPYYDRSFIEWDVRAPLEVIYEGEEAEQNDGVLTEFEANVLQRYASLSLYYPESDSDDSSSSEDIPAIGDCDSPENLCFYWEDFDREGLIEIALDYKKSCEFDEDNLIEIDLSPAR